MRLKTKFINQLTKIFLLLPLFYCNFLRFLKGNGIFFSSEALNFFFFFYYKTLDPDQDLSWAKVLDLEINVFGSTTLLSPPDGDGASVVASEQVLKPLSVPAEDHILEGWASVYRQDKAVSILYRYKCKRALIK